MRAVEFVLIVVYAWGCIYAALGASLYIKAYRQMKKTRIILATHILLAAIAFDTCWWFFTEFIRFMDPTNQYPAMMVYPPVMLIPKAILAAAITFFVHASVSENAPCP